MPKEILVKKEYAGISPKSFVKKFVDAPYPMLYSYIKDKRITLNGKKIKDEMKLKEGDVIKLWLDSIKLKEDKKGQKKVVSRNLGIPLIFENKEFLVLNKLAGIVVQGAQDNDTSLSYHLQFLKEKNKDNSDEVYFHVHRLDKDTSGILICAKNIISRRDLNAMFKNKDTVKKYVCLCIGRFKQKKGKVEVFLDRTPQGAKEKVVVGKEGQGKYSLSFYNVIEEFNFKNESFSLVEVEIKTGVTHQIRVHMKSLGHPIVGDKMYGNRYVNEMFFKVLQRQFLHAKSLDFVLNGKKFSFEAKLTDDLINTLKFVKKGK